MSLEREIRKIMASSVQENFVKNPDCDICGDGSPCTCGESQEIDEKLDDKDIPAVKKIIGKLKGASKAHAGQAKSLEKEIQDDVEEDIRNLPKDKQRALQHADKTAKPKSKVSLAPTPGIKTEESNLDEAFEEFFAEGMKVFFVSGSNAEGNVHAKNEKEAIAKAKKKGIKGKLTIRDKGKAVQPKFVESVNEGYEGEVKKVLDKKGIDAYFKNGKLMVSKRDKPAVMKILKGQDFDMPTIQVEEIQMKSNRFGLSVSLVDAVADVLAGKRPVDEMKMKKDDEDEKKKAKKAPVTDKDDDGDGMDPVGQEDGDIDNDGDKDDTDKFLAKRRKAIGKAMKGEKSGSKEPVDTKPKMDEAKLRELNKSTLQSYIAKKKADIKRKDANTATGRGQGGGKDRYDDSTVTGKDGKKAGRLDVDRSRDRANVKLAKAKVAYKDANRDPTGPSSPDKKKVSMEDMTDAQMKRREEIVKELKKKSADFESRYGDKADAVMYATATKMAMKGK